ncbi:hypothetical protein CgunFtcFv8_020345 [Champsocephalus gunnari]|nr:hypothetical protein CgunFtcFv8_020345 [Champsocephalus gunnari]
MAADERLLLHKATGLNFPKESMKVFFVVVLLVERLIFPLQHYTRVTVLSGELMFILGSQIPTFPKQGMTDLDEYRCLLYSAAPISQDGVEAAEEKTFIFFFQSRC